MVNKLGLKTEKLAHPYILAWFREGSDVPIRMKCLVSFSIGKVYKNLVWCDVTPLIVCHILLDRPCQFNRKVTHDGENNTYTLVKDGI